MLCVHTRPKWMPRPRRPATEISQSVEAVAVAVAAVVVALPPPPEWGQPVQKQHRPTCSDKEQLEETPES